MKLPEDIIFIVIDPQKGFSDPAGSLARKYDYESEFGVIRSALKNIAEMQSAWKGESVLVCSEYRPGQFTGGDLESPLANLCVPGSGVDCGLASELEICTFHQTFVKGEHSALSSSDFESYLEDKVAAGVRGLLVSGLLLEYCVQSTCLDVREKFGESLDIFLPLNLSASVESKNSSGLSGSVIKGLEAAGVQIIESGIHPPPGRDAGASDPCGG